MKAIISIIFTLLVCCGSTAAYASDDQKRFNFEEWKRKTYELSHPNPANPKLDAKWRALFMRSRQCTQRYLEKNATPTGQEKKLAEEACHACDFDVVAEGVANYENDKVRMPLNADRDKSIKSERDFCRFSRGIEAAKIISDLLGQKEIQMKESLKKEYLAKIDQAVKCSSYAAAIYAIATTETAQSIATAAFNKCGDLWNEAAKVALDLYPSISEFEQRDALRIDWMNRGISVVVDQRAKQKLTPPLPEYQKKPETKQDGTGI